ncbi:hypothetical protein L3476_21925 [Paenibacillus thiaminolyticus]|uniref:hypothetical protein n=1 Tax=Paenibacillus thiaminolyticus TaxID=49283 RepID=UPI00235090D3|nr:hypothetical protein [Paenibacillus thiaminolyticus]WCR25924.1 hypothetical protein L3476_21925 [Paenibacillus thiaminolyticus]
MRRIPHPPANTVHVMGGVYHQKLKITRSGSAVAGPITFQSGASHTAIIDETGPGLSASNVEVGGDGGGTSGGRGRGSESCICAGIYAILAAI